MKSGHAWHIRPMTTGDVDQLRTMDANYESPAFLDVVKEVQGLNVTWRLIERPFTTPFISTDFDFDEQERREIRCRFETADGLWLVAAVAEAGSAPDRPQKLVGMVDVKREAWRNAGFVWNIAVDRAHRGRGLGRELMAHVIQWGKGEGLRAIILETQTNNWHACRFYQHLGFQLSGIDDHFYTNRDIANKEVALFWTYEL